MNYTQVDREAAILDFLRQRGSFSEFSPEETVDKLLKAIHDSNLLKKKAELSVDLVVVIILNMLCPVMHEDSSAARKRAVDA